MRGYLGHLPGANRIPIPPRSVHIDPMFHDGKGPASSLKKGQAPYDGVITINTRMPRTARTGSS